MASRREQRESALKICFANFFSHQSFDEINKNLKLSENEEMIAKQGELCTQLSNAVITNFEEYDKKIEAKLKDWTLNRISTIDHVIMRLAIAEFEECPEIASEVTMNEMLELSKKYSTEKSRKFINGVLDAILKDYKK